MNSIVTCLINANKYIRAFLLAVVALGGASQVHAALTAGDDTATTNEDTTLRIAFTTLLSNDTGGVTPLTILSVFGASNGTVTIDGTDVVFTPTSHFSGTATFSYIAEDSTTPAALSDSATVTVTVNPVSDAPTLTVQSATGDEDAAIPLNINITAIDTDFSETLTVKIENIPSGASLDNSSHDVPSITFVSGVGSVTLSASQLNQLSIKPPANSDADFNLSVTGTSTDGSASAANSSNSPATLSVTVNAVSDAPTLTVQNASGNEDSEISLSITVTATDSTETLIVTINTIPSGATLLSGTTPITINNSSATLTSSQLSALKIIPPPNSDADFALGVSATSQDGTANPVSTQPVNLNVLVNPVNDEPSFTKGPNITIEEDAPAQFFSNWATAITPGGGEFGQVLTFQVTIPTSAASLFTVPPSISPEGHLTFETAPNANASATTVTVTLKDNGGTNPGDDTSASETFTITVTAVNDAPRLMAPFQQSMKEDTTLEFSAANNNLISVADPDAGSVTRLSLSVQSGKLKFTTTTGLTFVSPTANDSANIVVEGTLSDLNAALAGNPGATPVVPGLKYTPDLEFNGPDTLVIVANDLFSGANLIDTKTVNVNVTPVNDQPQITNTTPIAFNVLENSPPGFFVGKVNATDADPGSSLNFVITTGNLGGVFNINSSSGEIFVSGKLDFEPLPTDKKFTLSVLVADTGIPSLSASATVTINVTDVNEPPQMLRQVFQANENLTTGSTIGSLVATDPDTTTPNSTRTFAIVSGNEDNKFALSSAGALTLSAALDFETRPSYELNVSVTDGGGLSMVAPVGILVIDNNEAPIISPRTFTVDENAPGGTFVGHVEAVDPDAGHRTNFSITGGNTDNKFGIDQVTGLITVRGPLDFETTPSYSLTVKATDNADSNLFSTATITVNVNNVNEIPLITAPTTMEIFEDTTITFATGAILVADDSGNELIDVTLKVEHGTLKLAGVANLTFESGADDTGRMRIRGKLTDLNLALNALQLTPELHFHGQDFLDILADDRGASGVGGPQSRITGVALRIKPVIDGAPTIRSVTVPFQTLSDQGIVIERNPVDGPEVTHFQITDITGGRLYHHNGKTEIVHGNFITSFEAQAGLRFLPTATSPPGAFKAKASLQDNTSGLGGTAATAQITVVKANQFISFPPIQGPKKFGDPAFLISATASSGLAVQFQVNGPAKIATHLAILDGASERPNPVTTSASGAAVAALEGSQLIFEIAYEGLSGVATGAHIHGPATAEQTAGVMIDLEPFAIGGFGTAGELKGTVTLTSGQLSAISSGQAYVNIHTSANSGGEIRGQLIAPTSTTGKILLITGAGNVNVTASEPGDDRFNPSPGVSQFLTISKANQSITFSAVPNKTYGDPDFPVSATASSGLPTRIEVTAGPAVPTLDATTQLPDGKIRILGAGNVTLVAHQDGNQNFNPAIPVSVNFNVARATLTASADNKTRPFGQPNPELTGNVSGIRSQDPINVVFTTPATPNSPSGTYDIFPTFEDPAGKLPNYNLNVTRGKLTVTENAAPVAQAQSVTTEEDVPKAITLTGTDAEGATLSFELASPPQHGRLEGTPPTFTYTPEPNYNGPDSFTFRASDGFRDSAPATINVNVTPINDSPIVPHFPNVGLRPNGPVVTIPLFGLAAGPPNEQQPLTVSASSGDTTKVTVQGVDQPTSTSPGALRIQPVVDATGSAQITVVVSDGQSANSTTSRSFMATIIGRGIRIVNTAGLVGAPVEVPVELVALGDENSLGFSIQFDNNKLVFVSAELGTDTSGTAAQAVLQVNHREAEHGRIGLGLALPAGQVFAAGTKQIALLHFDIPTEAQESTTRIGFTPQPVFLEVVNALANPLPAAFDGGDVAISFGFEADVAPRPFGSNTGAVTATDWTQVGLFAIHAEEISSPSEFRRTDCAPREVDAQLILGDGVIGIADWVQAGRYAAGLDLVGPETARQVPKGGGPFGPPSQTTGQGLNSSLNSLALKSTGRAARQIKLHDRRVERGRNFVVLATLESRGDENAAGFSFSFDPKALRFTGARLANEARNATLLTNEKDAESGRVGLALALPPGQSFGAGSKALIELEFSSISLTQDSSALIAMVDSPVRRELVSATADELLAGYSDAKITFQDTAMAGSQNPVSKPLTVVDRSASGEMFLLLNGQPGDRYVIESSVDLATWVPLRTVTMTDRQVEVVDPEARRLSGRFYRLVPAR
ncbi:MAG: cadherin domain-containing protein [Verrucomicrobia bacterium]|nr:cadherin domain-containing protein [Verrucomicrobiota bacterium]